MVADYAANSIVGQRSISRVSWATAASWCDNDPRRATTLTFRPAAINSAATAAKKWSPEAMTTVSALEGRPFLMDSTRRESARSLCGPRCGNVRTPACRGGPCRTRLYIVDVDGDKLRRLTSGSHLHDFYASWSPDGRRILFERQSSEGGGAINVTLHTIRPNGHGLAQISTGGVGNEPRDPDWSPDGNYIVFFASPEGHTQIYVVRSDGTGLTTITGGTADTGGQYASWSPDGEYIVFTGLNGIEIMRPDGSDRLPLNTEIPGASLDLLAAWQPV